MTALAQFIAPQWPLPAPQCAVSPELHFPANHHNHHNHHHSLKICVVKEREREITARGFNGKVVVHCGAVVQSARQLVCVRRTSESSASCAHSAAPAAPYCSPACRCQWRLVPRVATAVLRGTGKRTGRVTAIRDYVHITSVIVCSRLCARRNEVPGARSTTVSRVGRVSDAPRIPGTRRTRPPRVNTLRARNLSRAPECGRGIGAVFGTGDILGISPKCHLARARVACGVPDPAAEGCAFHALPHPTITRAALPAPGEMT
jgi:hypothetical protein